MRAHIRFFFILAILKINHNYVLSHSFNSICVYFSYNSLGCSRRFASDRNEHWVCCDVYSFSLSFFLFLSSSVIAIRFSFVYIPIFIVFCNVPSVSVCIFLRFCWHYTIHYACSMYTWKNEFLHSTLHFFSLSFQVRIFSCVPYGWNYKCKCYYSKQTKRVKYRVNNHL